MGLIGFFNLCRLLPAKSVNVSGLVNLCKLLNSYLPKCTWFNEYMQDSSTHSGLVNLCKLHPPVCGVVNLCKKLLSSYTAHTNDIVGVVGVTMHCSAKTVANCFATAMGSALWCLSRSAVIIRDK